jgi:hypothetical protein
MAAMVPDVRKLEVKRKRESDSRVARPRPRMSITI